MLLEDETLMLAIQDALSERKKEALGKSMEVVPIKESNLIKSEQKIPSSMETPSKFHDCTNML
jgi:hypothetical protein